MLKRLIAIALSGVIFFASTGCASIISKSSYPIHINSTPNEAHIVITNKKGVEVFSGTTPATTKLRSGSGYFGKAQYYVKFEKPGFQSKTVPVEFKIDGWYFGNLLLGGIVGMLIVDPLTGAMYKLDTEFLNETLAPAAIAMEKSNMEIYSLSQIPDEWKSHLQPLGI